MALFRKTASPPAATDRASITETAPCQKSVRVRVTPDVLAPLRSTIVAEFARQATLPGFRKGKAPADLIERQYGKEIHDETLHRATRQAFEQVTKEHQLKPVGPFEVTKADYADAQGLTLEALVEVEPAFALGQYKGLALKRPPVEVTPDDLDRSLKNLQESMAQLVPKAEGQEEKERKVPALDDELAKDLGFKTLEELKGHVEAKLRESRRAAQSQALENDLCEELLRRHAFDVPPRLVARQTERLARDFKVRLMLSGKTEAQVEDEAPTFTEQLRTSAERLVKLGFLLDRIAEQESISVTQDELVARLWQLSQRWKKDPAEVRKFFDSHDLWPSVVSTIRQEKTITWLLSAASIEDGAAVAAPTAHKGGGA
ncbi:MAG: hypothetical protein COV75_02665 [Candidatus Omnitrophica bacterium CG11_big_fil_rev_8_21_14_0_20_63_9]|nr:MAG: hypothetical protein COV75_02665 [Candidatus Omnitrophica bacterium CG11_big_fil_rev_8_21_14_0_20_63_9]